MADFYQILGVSRDADADTLKRAYRKLARQYHPDVNKESGAEEKFKEIGKAYDEKKDLKELLNLSNNNLLNSNIDSWRKVLPLYPISPIN